MPNEKSTIKELAREVEAYMRSVTAERGLRYTLLRKELFISWFSAGSLDNNELVILEQALQFQQRNDTEGLRAASLAFLKTRFGAQIGDTVNLHGFDTARDVTIEDFYLELDEQDLQKNSTAWFIGPCDSTPAITKHGQRVHSSATTRTGRLG